MQQWGRVTPGRLQRCWVVFRASLHLIPKLALTSVGSGFYTLRGRAKGGGISVFTPAFISERPFISF